MKESGISIPTRAVNNSKIVSGNEKIETSSIQVLGDIVRSMVIRTPLPLNSFNLTLNLNCNLINGTHECILAYSYPRGGVDE
jgi:hypothetical protein